MEWFWNWGGECFGYRDGDALYAYHGLQVGQFYGDEIYGADGHYLGEIMNGDRLITHKGKKAWRRSPFSPMRNGPSARFANYAGYAMYAGHEDFPLPDEF